MADNSFETKLTTFLANLQKTSDEIRERLDRNKAKHDLDIGFYYLIMVCVICYTLVTIVHMILQCDKEPTSR
jgi:hypothetical protein